MKTYTMDIDGKPSVAFRAKDEAHATEIAESLWRWMQGNGRTGTMTTRLASVSEQAYWRSESVECQECHDDPDNEDEGEDYDPDDLRVSLPWRHIGYPHEAIEIEHNDVRVH